MNELQTVVDKIDHETLGKSPNGCRATFVKLNDSVGIKLYEDEEQRDYCLERQSLAEEYDLGPDTFGIMNIPERAKVDCRFGYLTECVPVVWDILPRDDAGELYWLIPSNVEVEGWDGTYQSFETCKAVNELYQKLAEIGIHLCDVHDENVGIKNGRFVCIDFGELY